MNNNRIRFASAGATRRRSQTWPHNGRPSSRHVWRELPQTILPGDPGAYGAHDTHREECLRCGRRFNAILENSGPIYCFPTKEWLEAHPDDDGKEGP